MELKIYINDKLWRTVIVEGSKYDPAHYWADIAKDKAAGLLDSYGINTGMKVEFRHA